MCVFQLPCLLMVLFHTIFVLSFFFFLYYEMYFFWDCDFLKEKKLYSKFSLDCKRNLFYIRIINIQNINSYFFGRNTTKSICRVDDDQMHKNQFSSETLDTFFLYVFSVVSSDNLVANIFIFLMFFSFFTIQSVYLTAIGRNNFL